MKVVNVGESLFLQVLIDGVLSTAVLHLFQNDLVADIGGEALLPTVVIEDLVEADYEGYAAQDLDALGNVWGAPALEADGRFGSTGDTDAEFTKGAGGVANDIYGSYLTDSEGELLAIQLRETVFTMDVEGNTIRITPYFSVQSRDELPTGPRVVSATVSEFGNGVTVVFDREVTGGFGFELITTGGQADLTYFAGTGTDTLEFLPSTTIYEAWQPAVLHYSGGDVEDADGNTLAAGYWGAVNNSTATP